MRVPASVRVASIALLVVATTARTDDAAAHFSTHFGGAIDHVAVAPDGTIYVSGLTAHTDLPASSVSLPDPDPGVWYVFTAAIGADGAPRWTTYDGADALAVDSDGGVWSAISLDFGGTPDVGNADIALHKTNVDGSRTPTIRLHASGDDRCRDLAMLPDGDLIVVGTTDFPDFPGTSGPASFDGDAFVARVHADGSGVAWAALLPRARQVDPTVAVDPTDGRVFVAVGAPSDLARRLRTRAVHVGGRRSPPYESEPSYVVAFSAGGRRLAATRVSFLGVSDGERAAVAVDRDGAVLVGGRRGVIRLSQDLSRVRGAWLHADRFTDVERIAVGPRGEVLVNEIAQYVTGAPQMWLLDTRLRRGRRFDRLDLAATDVAVDASGAVVAVANDVVAKAPIDSDRPPSTLRASVVDAHALDLAWSSDGDPPDHFEVDALGEGVAAGPWTVDAAALAFRVGGLSPGTEQRLRLAAVFASGGRSTVFADATTAPVEPIDVVVTRNADHTATISYDASANGQATKLEVRRRIADGPWIDVSRATDVYGYHYYAPPIVDALPDAPGAVTYRVRTLAGGATSAWIVRAVPAATPTLRVAMTAAWTSSFALFGTFVVEGRLISTDPSQPATFNPATQGFDLIAGDASNPNRFTLAAGDAGWSRIGSRVVWRNEGGVAAADIVTIRIDLATGRFRLDGDQGFVYPTTSRPPYAMAVNFAFGSFSGGAIEPLTIVDRHLELRR